MNFSSQKIMDAGACLKCGNRVNGHVKDIVLTLYCQNCFHMKELSQPLTSKEMYWTWTSAPEAAYKKGINPNNLSALRFKAVRRNCDGLHPFSRHYLMAEVEALSALPRERIRSESQARRAERQEKREALIQATGLHLQGLNATIQLLLLGEYLSGACITQNQLDVIVERCRVMPRVVQILDCCKDAHPEAAINFCLQYPDAGPMEFQELKEKMRLVFRLQGFRILGMLWYDIRKLIGSPLHDVCQRFLRRDRIGCVRGYLEPMVGPVEAENIVKHPVCLEYLRRIGPDDNDRYVIKQLLQFWNERGSRQERSDRLMGALASRGTAFPNDAMTMKLCEDYINGKKFILLEEVMQRVLKSWMYQIQKDFKNGIWRQ